MPLWKVHELTFLWFGLPGPLLKFGNLEMHSHDRSRRIFFVILGRTPKGQGNLKGWFPKGWFWRMFPRNENRNEGTFAKTTLLETALLSLNDPFGCWQKGGFQKGGFQKDVPPERKPERGYVRQNHPFGNRPFISQWPFWVLTKGWFPKGWFRQMFPRNENRNEGTFAKTTLLRNRPFISQWKGTYSPRGCCKYLLETPFSEPFLTVKPAASPLLRTLLRTLPQNPPQNPSQNPS